jgi:hypothetical protein
MYLYYLNKSLKFLSFSSALYLTNFALNQGYCFYRNKRILDEWIRESSDKDEYKNITPVYHNKWILRSINSALLYIYLEDKIGKLHHKWWFANKEDINTGKIKTQSCILYSELSDHISIEKALVEIGTLDPFSCILGSG